MLQRIEMASQSYEDRSLPVSAQRLVNLYAEPKPRGSKSERVIYATPGLTLWSTCGSGPIRGMLGMGTFLYVVSGTDVYEVDSDGTATVIGSVTGSAPVSMATNGTQLAIVCDSEAFYIEDSVVASLGLTNVAGVAFQDGYGLFAELYTQKFFISAIDDFTTLVGTEFVLVNAYPDSLVGIANSNRETWLFGTSSTQVYANTGNPLFPFERIPAGVIERGCIASRSIASFQGAVFWLGDDKRVYMSDGYRPQPISTPAIDRAIASYSSPQTATGFAYSQEGHIFYCLGFDDATWVYDVTTGMWHERKSTGLSYWRARSHVFFADQHLVGDGTNGCVYTLDLDAYTENSATIIRIADSPPVHAGTLFATMNQFRLDLESGVGLNTGQGSDPQVMLSWSDDGGRSWSNEHWRSAGSIGEFGKRCVWNRLGRFRQRVLRVQISDPVKVVLIDAFADVEVGET